MRFIYAVIIKELRTLLRSRKSFVILLLILLAPSALFIFVWSIDEFHDGNQSRIEMSRVLFALVTFIEIIALGLVAPIMTATAVTSEREGKTLELLYCTRLSRFQILIGKWIATLFFQIIIIACLMPIVGLCFQLGGVGTEEYFFALILAGVVVLTYGMVGLACSARYRKTISALLMALFFVLFLSVGYPMLIVIIDETSRSVRIDLPPRNMDDGGISYILSYSLFVSPLMASGVIGEELVSFNSNSQPSTFATLTGSTYFQIFLAMQSGIFLIAALLGWTGLDRADAKKVPKALKTKADKYEGKAWAKKWRLSLLYRLRRSREIQDRQNPMTVKEIRSGTFTRKRVLFRFGGVAAICSFFAFLSINNSNLDLDDIKYLLSWAFTFVLPFLPIAAASCICREREENTMDLLRTSLLGPWKIIRGKLRSGLRLPWTIFLTSLLTMFLFRGISIACYRTSSQHPKLGVDFYIDPIIVEDFISGLLYGYYETIGPFLMVALPVACFIIFYASLSLFYSTLFRKTLTSLVVSYLTILSLLIYPYIMLILTEITRNTDPIEKALRGILVITGPFVSPYYYLFPIDRFIFGNNTRFLDHWLDISPVLIVSGILLAFSLCILRAATVRLKKLSAP